MPDYEHLKYREEDELAIISLNRPPVNALSSEFIAEIDEALDQVIADETKKALIITSSLQQFFIAGADIKEIDKIKSAEHAKELVKKGKDFLEKIETMGIPVIAAINGVCLGGGLELAMACHFRVAAESALFGQPEINLGIIPGFGGTQRLARIVGRSKALEMILTGDNIGARKAEELGLVNMVVPEDSLLKQSRSLAWKITKKGRVAVAAALLSVIEGMKGDFARGMDLETEQFGVVTDSEDMREGVTAFLEKRQPKFKDR